MPDGKNGKDIKNYWYREKIKVYNENPLKIKEYLGASNKPNEKEIKKGGAFIFNDVFHLEHMYPIDMVITDLRKLDEVGKLTYDTLVKVLDKIYICRITKEEDRAISSEFKSKRPENLEDIEKIVYSKIDILK